MVVVVLETSWRSIQNAGGGGQYRAQQNLEHRKALEIPWSLECQECLRGASRTHGGRGQNAGGRI